MSFVERVRWRTAGRARSPCSGAGRKLKCSSTCRLKSEARQKGRPKQKWGLALLPAPTAPSEGYAGVRNLVHFGLSAQPYPLSILAHQLRRRFLPNSSLFRGARPIYSTARPEGSLVFRPFRPGVWNRSPSKPKPSSVPRPFLGRPLLRPALLTDDPKTTRNRVALEEDNSSGASSRLARSEPEGSSQSCRRRSDLWSPAAPPAVAGSWRGRDRRPDHTSTMHPCPESRKRKMRC